MNREIKVNFVVGGVQKGGTSALDAYLRKHPELDLAERKDIPDYQNDPNRELEYPPKVMAYPKEPHFFDTEEYFASAEVDYSIYHGFFSPREGVRLYGESTPVYTYWQEAPRRMWEYNPEMKIIVLLRDPVKRAYSHWNMMRDLLLESLPFEEALAREEARAREARPLQNKRHSYIDRGFYSEQLRRLWRFFPREQVLVLKSERLFQEPNQVLEQVAGFLGIAPFPELEQAEVNTGKYREPMSEQAGHLLRETFQGEVKTLENMLSWDCGDWLAPR